MRSFISSSIFLVANLLVASSQLLSPEHLRQVSGCRYPTFNNFETYIYFSTPDDPSFKFSILTPWTDTYDKILRKALPAYGFLLEPEPTNTTSEICDWAKLEDVWANGILYGDISYREKTTIPSISSSRIPRNTHRSPDKSTLNKIRSFLLSNPPSQDIMMLALEIVLPFLGLNLLLVLILYPVYQRAREADVEKDIELCSIEAPVTPDQSIQDLKLPEQLKVKDYRRWDSSHKAGNSAEMFYTVRI